MIRHKELIITRTAKEDLTGKEGYFAVINSDGTCSISDNSASMTSASSFIGLLHTAGGVGETADLILPGFSGIVEARIGLNGPGATPGKVMKLNSNGTLSGNNVGLAVAVALEEAAAGEMVAVRLLAQPYSA